ncbi:hypothetical protein [Streptomyces sp. NRRL B-24484]|nr:hypothetical protein [Streptomyces sp. NRRL B-24484]
MERHSPHLTATPEYAMGFADGHLTPQTPLGDRADRRPEDGS